MCWEHYLRGDLSQVQVQQSPNIIKGLFGFVKGNAVNIINALNRNPVRLPYLTSRLINNKKKIII